MNATSSSEEARAKQSDHVDLKQPATSPWRCESGSIPKDIGLKSHVGFGQKKCQTFFKAFMKNRKNYVGTSIATLTQSGLLAEMLQHQRRRVIELNQRRTHREEGRGFFRNSLTWLLARSQNITAGRRFRRGLTVARHT